MTMRDFVLDRAVILDRLGGDEEIMTMILSMYLDDCDGYCQQLGEACRENNASVLHREAHTVKGVLATLSDEEGAGLAFLVEQQAKRGDIAGAASRVEELITRLRHVEGVVRTLI